MEQEKVVLKAMDSIYKLAPKLTISEQEIIRHHLRLVCGAGYDEGYSDRTPNNKPIKQVKDGKELQRFPSIKVASNTLGISVSAISRSLNGRTEVCSDGSRWEYVD
jgi:hypothetical protein